VNTAEAMAVPGVIQVIPMPFGVAVLANTVEATRAARNVLKPKVTWTIVGVVGATHDSDKAKEEYARNGRAADAKPMTAYKKGEAADALASAAKVIEASYWTEYTAHAQL
jgi:isoquinoline 1-oxidoreductase beta subunit